MGFGKYVLYSPKLLELADPGNQIIESQTPNRQCRALDSIVLRDQLLQRDGHGIYRIGVDARCADLLVLVII